MLFCRGKGWFGRAVLSKKSFGINWEFFVSWLLIGLVVTKSHWLAVVGMRAPPADHPTSMVGFPFLVFTPGTVLGVLQNYNSWQLTFMGRHYYPYFTDEKTKFQIFIVTKLERGRSGILPEIGSFPKGILFPISYILAITWWIFNQNIEVNSPRQSLVSSVSPSLVSWRKRGLRSVATGGVCSCGLQVGLSSPALDTWWDQLGTFDMVWFKVRWKTDEKRKLFERKKSITKLWSYL